MDFKITLKKGLISFFVQVLPALIPLVGGLDYWWVPVILVPILNMSINIAKHIDKEK